MAAEQKEQDGEVWLTIKPYCYTLQQWYNPYYRTHCGECGKILPTWVVVKDHFNLSEAEVAEIQRKWGGGETQIRDETGAILLGYRLGIW